MRKQKILALLVLLGTFLYSAAYLADAFFTGENVTLGEDSSSYGHLVLFLLINLNIIVIMVLAFLVVRNVTHLILDRRRGFLGSALRTRLVLAFVGLSFFPTLVLFLLAKGIIGSVTQSWFAPQVGQSFEHSFALVRAYYDEHEGRIQAQMKLLADDLLPTHAPEIEQTAAAYNKLIEDYRNQLGFYELSIVDEAKNTLAYSTAQTPQVEPLPVTTRALQDALNLSVFLRAENNFGHEYLRAYVRLDKLRLPASINPAGRRLVLCSAVQIPAAISSTFRELNDGYDEYRSLASSRRPITSTYLLLLVGGTLFITFLAIWVGFRLAGNISEPIKLLAQGTEQLAKGNLDFRIPHVGDDELGTLVDSFNIMTTDLQKATDELEERRRYMETVLARIDIGVVSLDRHRLITTCNAAAMRILRIDTTQVVVGRKPAEFLPPDLTSKFHELLDELEETHEVVTTNLTVPLRNDIRHVQVTLTELVDDRGSFLGNVVLVDDLSELFKAQRLAAWRDVARRIAHEIKNPLTPIQLSAERIQRRFAAQLKEAKAVPSTAVTPQTELFCILDECLQTIVSQVQTLRNMVNEFSRFARLPKSAPQNVDLVELLQGLCKMYQEAHPHISFQFDSGDEGIVLKLDRDQMNRVFVNLLDNAVSSVDDYYGENQAAGEAKVTITARNDSDLGIVSVELGDNGAGIAEADKRHIFEPYFSRRKGGTGLGLAIVSAIVADHNGFVRVRDNRPRGVVFRVELPS